MDDKQFLIFLAVDAFNTQFGRNYKPTDFDCTRIETDHRTRCAFEFFTITPTDSLRLRLFCQFATINRVFPYQLNVAGVAVDLELGDEVWVADAFLDQEFLYAGNNFIRRSCPDIVSNPTDYIVLTAEDDTYLLTEDGAEIVL